LALDILGVRRRIATEGRVLPVIGESLGIFDPAVIAKLDRANFADLHMPPRLADAIRGAPDRCPVLWKDVRALLFEQTRKLNTPETLRRLHGDMVRAVDRLAGRETDLTWVAERAVSTTLIPYILGGLSSRELRLLVRDQHTKIENVLYAPETLLRGPYRLFPALRRLRDAWHETAAGRVIAHHLRGRRAGTMPPQRDYAEALMPMIDRLGIARASYVVATILTAVAGAPGTVGACLLFELLTRPEWLAKVREELASVDEDDLFEEPVRSAPLAHRFVKEALRLWAFPLIAQRAVFRDFEVDEFSMAQGQAYFLSAYLVHRDPAYWDNPDSFDPDRWLRADRAPTPGAYAPFGWGPRTCVGGALGLSQMMLFMHIVATRFDFVLRDDAAARIDLDGIAAPVNFLGTVTRRPD